MCPVVFLGVSAVNYHIAPQGTLAAGLCTISTMGIFSSDKKESKPNSMAERANAGSFTASVVDMKVGPSAFKLSPCGRCNLFGSVNIGGDPCMMCSKYNLCEQLILGTLFKSGMHCGPGQLGCALASSGASEGVILLTCRQQYHQFRRMGRSHSQLIR